MAESPNRRIAESPILNAISSNSGAITPDFDLVRQPALEQLRANM